MVRQACQRHLNDRAHADARGWLFDEAAADHAIGFFERFLCLPDTKDAAGDPRPFLLEPWQAFIVGSLFGWRSPAGMRRFRTAYIEVGKGNGKTPLAAGIGLYGLVMDGERAAEIYSAAVTFQQANILFMDAVRMRELSPHLASRLFHSVNNLAYEPTLSFFRPVSSEHRQLDGKRVHMGLIDEIHEHPNALVVNKIRAGCKGRSQPLIVEITNSGYNRTSICWQHHDYSRHVLSGTASDDAWFAYVCALDEGDDPLEDEGCWLKANPNLGVSIPRSYLIEQVKSAKAIPAELNTVLRLNFCIWTQAVSRFFDIVKWHACAAEVPDAELDGVPCYAGLDLGQSDDFSAFVRIWMLEDGRVAVRCRFWIPQVAIERRPHRDYQVWRDAGVLQVTDGDITDYDVVEAAVLEACQASGVRVCAYDKRFAQHMALHLQAAGVEMVDTPQGYALSEALNRLSDWVIEGSLCHGGDPVLGWMANNMVVRRSSYDGRIRPDKFTAADKIDGIVALAMAVSRVVAQELEPPSIYESRGVLTV